MNAQTAHDSRFQSGLVIETSRFGVSEQVTVAVADLYTFAEAMPGLPDSHRFALIRDEAYAPLRWLQSLDEEVICLPVLALDALEADDVIGGVAAALGLDADAGQRALLVTHFDAAGGSFVINLLAPLVLDAASATGRQVILEGQSYPLRQPLAWHAETRTFSRVC